MQVHNYNLHIFKRIGSQLLPQMSKNYLTETT